MRGSKIIHTGQRSVTVCYNFIFVPFSSVMVGKIHVLDNQDGADIGYGAKAEEVLGQVKGRYNLKLCNCSFNVYMLV